MISRICHTTTQHPLAMLLCSLAMLGSRTAASQEKDFNAYPKNVASYLERIYDLKHQPLAYREDYAGGFQKWQQAARKALRKQIGLPKIAVSVGDHKPVVQLDNSQDHGEYWR